MAKKLWSIFTDDMDHCIYTGSPVVERHHVFSQMGGGIKKICEQYGYIAPLRPDLHPNGVQADGKKSNDVDKYLKEKCQLDFEEKHGNRALFIQMFGKSYL